MGKNLSTTDNSKRKKMKKIFKVKSFLPGNTTCQMNACRELMRTPLKKIECLAMQHPEIIKTYDFNSISSLVTRRGIDGSEVNALPDNVYGIASLSREEIKKLKPLNLIIVDKNNNTF